MYVHRTVGGSIKGNHVHAVVVNIIGKYSSTSYIGTSNKNIHFEMILDVGIGEKRKETRFLI